MNYTAKKTQVVAFVVREDDGTERTVTIEKGAQAPVHSPEDAFPHLREIFEGLPRYKESFVVLALDTRRRVLGHDVVSTGTLDAALVHPREVFGPLLTRDGVSAFLVAHNHPSGETDPSPEDLALTRRLAGAGDLMGITMIDHLVVTPTAFCSIRAEYREVFY